MIQGVLVILTVVSAIVYLANKMYMRFSEKKKSCDGCAMGKTSSNETKPA